MCRHPSGGARHNSRSYGSRSAATLQAVRGTTPCRKPLPSICLADAQLHQPAALPTSSPACLADQQLHMRLELIHPPAGPVLLQHSAFGTGVPQGYAPQVRLLTFAQAEGVVRPSSLAQRAPAQGCTFLSGQLHCCCSQGCVRACPATPPDLLQLGPARGRRIQRSTSLTCISGFVV